MRLVDLNVLIYATDRATARHEVANRWLAQALASTQTLALPTAVTVGYIRLTTSPRVMRSPQPVGQAVQIVNGWLERPNVVVPHPTARHYDIVAELLAATGLGGNLVSDAHVAALAIEHGAELCSFDTDFLRFPGLVATIPGD